MLLVLLPAHLAVPPARAETTECASTHFHKKAHIKKVIDGDTIILSDQQRVRLIGINTPEIFHDDRPADPGAMQAKQQLQQILDGTRFVGLRFDKETSDRHGRTLAHVFLPSGKNIQAMLLEAGLAIPLFIPPSVDYAECYARVAELARRAGRGLWSLPGYQPVAVSELNGQERGFRILRGRVRYISDSRSAVWINLENNVAVRVTRPDLAYFNALFLQQLPGKFIEVRGWLYEHNDQLRMRLRFPLDLSIID